MRKWVTLGLVAAVALVLAGVSFADVPSALTSTVTCQCTANPSGGASTQLPYKCTISVAAKNPSDNINIAVVVRNVLGAPLAGSTVTTGAVGVGGATFVWDPGPPPPSDPAMNPQTGLSDVNGNWSGVWNQGGVSWSGVTTYPNLDYSISASGPGPGGAVTLSACVPQLQVNAFDLNADGLVNLTDFAIFAGDLGSQNPRSDFNWSGGVTPVNLTDFAMFAAQLNSSFADN